MTTIPTPGTVLPNGATVLKVKHNDGQTVVLAQNGREYVTWKLDEAGNAYYGNYYKDLADAEQNFVQRR